MDAWLLDRRTERSPVPEGTLGAEASAAPGRGEALVCVSCGSVVTDTGQAISVGGAHEHTFVNPAGIIYRIRCFRAAPGCREIGEPTEEFSWFAGFAWSYTICATCSAHLGWVFRDAAGSAFYGLISDRLAQGRAS